MEKILLAVGNREMEEYLKKILANEVQFVGETVYREGVMRSIGQTGPSLVILRDALKGSTDMLSLIYDIRMTYPDIRILFIGIPREPRDLFYANLVNYGVYDLVVGGKINVNEIISRIRVPAKHSEVTHFQPAPPVKEGTVEEVVPTPITLETDEPTGEGEDETFDIVDGKGEKATPLKEDKEKKPGLFSRLRTNKENPKEESKEVGKKDKLPEDPEEEEVEEEVDVARKRFGFLKKSARESGLSQHILGMGNAEFSKDKIITFIGGRSGVGTTALAVNTAFELASRGNEVLYLEVNQRHPSATYWFDTGLSKQGIDTALKALEEKRYADLQLAIVKGVSLKKKESAMKANYKRFPEGLDFMSYSGDYLMGLEERGNLPELKELYLYLMYQGGYDYVVVDLSFFAEERDIQGAIMYSNKVFTVVNQDISTVGYHLAYLNSLELEGVSLSKKNHYIVNSYLRSKFGLKDLQEWLGTESVIVVPQSTMELSESNAKGLPTVLHNKRADFSEAIREITKIIGGNKK